MTGERRANVELASGCSPSAQEPCAGRSWNTSNTRTGTRSCRRFCRARTNSGSTILSPTSRTGQPLRAAREPAAADDADPAKIAGVLHLCHFRHAGRVGRNLEQAEAHATAENPLLDELSPRTSMNSRTSSKMKMERRIRGPRAASAATPEQLVELREMADAARVQCARQIHHQELQRRGPAHRAASRFRRGAGTRGRRAAEGRHLHRIAPDSGIPLRHPLERPSSPAR